MFSKRDKEGKKIRAKRYRENCIRKDKDYYHHKYLKDRKHQNWNKWQKRQTNLNFRLRKNLRTRIYHALMRMTKSEGTVELIGCSVENFIKYIESLFQDGMTWNNYGQGRDKWHIDHIIPCTAFDLTVKEEQFKID